MIHPFLLLSIVSLPLVLLAAGKKVYPHTPMVWLATLPCLASVALLLGAQINLSMLGIDTTNLTLLVLALDGAIIAIAILDLASLPWGRAITAERTTGKTASLKKPHRVTLTVMNQTRRDFRVEFRDDLPEGFQAEPPQFSVHLRRRSRVTVHYDLLASRRGAFRLERIYFRARSRLGMWRRYINIEDEAPLNVYPDMRQLSQYAILARTNRLSLMGVRRTRRVGQDNEFERLRDYTLDDNYKHIDWRTTARRNKLTVKDFQTNQSQRLIFLIDSGRMMTNIASGVSLLDHALNAMLMLSYVALKQGDAVGLIHFSSRVQSYVPPRGGMTQMNRLLHASYDQFPELVESRYDEAFMHLSHHCPKRALVILISNVIDEVNANQIERYLSTLVGRHLPLGVLLRDHALFDAAERNISNDTDLYRAGAAAEILNWRHQVLRDLEHQGVMSLDVFPEDMTAPLVNSYLSIKARHLL